MPNPRAVDVLSLDDLKDELRIPRSETGQDNLLCRHIDAAAEAVGSWIQMPLVAEERHISTRNFPDGGDDPVMIRCRGAHDIRYILTNIETGNNAARVDLQREATQQNIVGSRIENLDGSNIDDNPSGLKIGRLLTRDWPTRKEAPLGITLTLLVGFRISRQVPEYLKQAVVLQAREFYDGRNMEPTRARNAARNLAQQYSNFGSDEEYPPPRGRYWRFIDGEANL